MRYVIARKKIIVGEHPPNIHFVWMIVLSISFKLIQSIQRFSWINIKIFCFCILCAFDLIQSNPVDFVNLVIGRNTLQKSLGLCWCTLCELCCFQFDTNRFSWFSRLHYRRGTPSKRAYGCVGALCVNDAASDFIQTNPVDSVDLVNLIKDGEHPPKELRVVLVHFV